MKFNQKGFSDTVFMAVIGGIIGSLFIVGVFIWMEIDKANTIHALDVRLSRVVRINKEENKEDEKSVKDNEVAIKYTKNKIEDSDLMRFESADLGFSFEYLEGLGQEIPFRKNLNPLDMHKSYMGISLGRYVGFLAPYSNYNPETDLLFTSSVGFVKEDDGYKLLYNISGEGVYKMLVEPIKVIDSKLGDILLLDDGSFVDEHRRPAVKVTLAAVINLDNNFSAVNFWNNDLDSFSQEEFEEMLRSLEFLDK